MSAAFHILKVMKDLNLGRITMQFKKLLMTTVLLTFGSFNTISIANADTATGSFNVGLVVESICNLTAGSASNIVLGTVSDGSVKTGTNNISVACSTGTPYKVGLKPKGNGSAGGTGILKGPGLDIAYMLTKDQAGSIAWGNTGITNTMDATGTGLLTPTAYPVYATTTSTTDVMPGIYSDTVDVTVTH